jgi:hypothetical protein
MMGETAKTFVAGIVAIGLVTAFGLHAAGLAQLSNSGGKAASGLLGTAEKG